MQDRTCRVSEKEQSMALNRGSGNDDREYVYDVYEDGSNRILRLKDTVILYNDRMKDGIAGMIPVQLKLDGKGRCTAQTYDMINDRKLIRMALDQFKSYSFSYLKAFHFSQNVLAIGRMLAQYDGFFGNPEGNNACMLVVDRQGNRKVLDLTKAMDDRSMLRQVDWVSTYNRLYSRRDEIGFFTRDYYEHFSSRRSRPDDERTYSAKGFGSPFVEGVGKEKPSIFSVAVNILEGQEDQLKEKTKPMQLTIEERKADIFGRTMNRSRELELIKGSREIRTRDLLK